MMMTPGGWPNGLATDLKISILFCTRLPLAHAGPIESGDVARASWAFPVVGALVGGIGALVYAIAWQAGLPPMVAATLGLAATLAVTGCLHEDGLADTADGFGGGRYRERKLDIMRDSRLGTFGACTLVISLLLRSAAVAAIAGPTPVALALIAAHASARAALPAFMRFVPPARPDGLSAQAGQPSPRCVTIAVLLGVAVLGIALGPGAAVVGIVLTAFAWLFMAWLSVRQIGGQTGDVLGALEQICEIVILLTAVPLLKAQP
jgi:adenosylcobinamide-GDP ribazoletransferase